MFVRPDWKTAIAYHDIEKASLTRIAWEFLRRNPDYQKAWWTYAQDVRELAALDQDVARYADLFLTANVTSAMLDSFWDATTREKLRHGLYDYGFFAPVPGIDGRFEPLDRQRGRSWGLDGMPHPMQSYYPTVVRFSSIGNTVWTPSSHSLKELEDEHRKLGKIFSIESNLIVLQIDLSLPLEVIESTVLRHIRWIRQHRINNHQLEIVKSRALSNARYVEYLRILDGASAGVAAPDIGLELAPRANNDLPDRPRDKRFRAALNEAKRIQATGYRVLPLLQRAGTMQRKK